MRLSSRENSERGRLSRRATAKTLGLLLLGLAIWVAAVALPCKAQNKGPASPNAGRVAVLSSALERFASTSVTGFNDHYYSIIVGIDSSGSFASDKLNFARLAVSNFLDSHVVSGEAVAAFHFGQQPYPLFSWQRIPTDPLGANQKLGNLESQINHDITDNGRPGTDVNYALKFGLDRAQESPLQNRLVLLVTDDCTDQATWSRTPGNVAALRQRLVTEGWNEGSRDLGLGVWIRYAYVLRDRNVRIKVQGGSPTPSGRTPREIAVAIRRVGTRPVIATSTPAVSSSPQASASPEATPDASDDSTRSEDKTGPIVAFAIFAGIATLLAFVLTRPLPLTVASGTETCVWIPLNQPYTIGGVSDGQRGFADPTLREPIARITHEFPKKLKITNLRSSTPCQIVLDDGQDVVDVPAILTSEADVTWTDPYTGRSYRLHITKGRPENPPMAGDAGQDGLN